MKREKYTEKLIRMIEAIESGDLPAKVLAFYVFGSYARGAIEPGDLDVIVHYEWPRKSTFDAWVEEKMAAGECHYDAVHQVATWVTTTMKGGIPATWRTGPLAVGAIIGPGIRRRQRHQASRYGCFGPNMIGIGEPSWRPSRPIPQQGEPLATTSSLLSDCGRISVT